MMMPTWHLRKNFLDEAFIQNTESFWVILLTSTFPLSVTIENGSLFVMSPSLVLPTEDEDDDDSDDDDASNDDDGDASFTDEMST